MITDVVVALSRPEENIMAVEQTRIVEQKKKDESEVNCGQNGSREETREGKEETQS